MKTDPASKDQNSFCTRNIYYPSPRQLQSACLWNDNQPELQLAISFHKEKPLGQVGHIIKGEQVKSACH